MRSRVFLLGGALTWCFAYSSGLELSVDLRTDYIAGLDFTSVEVQSAATAPLDVDPWPGAVAGSVSSSTGADLIEGARLADFSGLPSEAETNERSLSPAG